MDKKEIPVLLLTGYLGSGKTTLLNHILTNEKGIRFAVIVNDLGEINIDASLIQKGGIVGQKEDDTDLVALQNGCICCTLKMDLVEQISELCASDKFDYIVIEASGICEPAPIAQTICMIPSMEEKYNRGATPRLDCIATVVDALRLRDEFGNGRKLTSENIDEEDIENLIIEQIEFCNIILLNKISEVSEAEAKEIKAVIRALQPEARIIECNYCDVPIDDLINTHLFNFEKVATSAAWVKELENPEHNSSEDHDEEHEHEHDHDHDHAHDHEEHHHHHHHHHDEGEAEEYGIQTYVYFRRPAFDMNRFDYMVNNKYPENIIRTKGIVYFNHNKDMSFLFEQAGRQKRLSQAGLWYATAPEEDLEILLKQDPGLMRDWDEEYGDRMIKLVVIGKNLDKKQIDEFFDSCMSPADVRK